jgi:DNA mismatch repair protein MutS
MLKQYQQIKAQYPDVVLFYRMGDFFEMFYDDAKLASEVLGLTLTRRNHGQEGDVPLAGFPHHQLEPYLAKMTRVGYRVAVCEQIEDPKKAKGIVKRAITEVVSAGTTFSDTVLNEARNNYLAALILHEQMAGLAYADVTTGEFFTGVLPQSELAARLAAIDPPEILCITEQKTQIESFLSSKKATLSILPRWQFTPEAASKTLTDHFGVTTLKGFGLSGLDPAIGAAGALVQYLRASLIDKPNLLPDLQVFTSSGEMVLDSTTCKNLEVIESLSGQSRGTLLSVLDKTRTAPGARLLRRWLLAPLMDLERILERQNRVAYLFEQQSLASALGNLLAGTGDLQRLLSRLSTPRGSARDAVNLRHVLEKLPKLHELFAGHEGSPLNELLSVIAVQTELVDFLKSVLADDPPLSVGDGQTVREGFSVDLDELRNIRKKAKVWIHEHQAEQRVKSGIPSLKIGYNKVFGYYIEITNPHKDKVPASYIRKQTLTSAERYVTPELKTWEEKILTADERISELETEIWEKVRAEITSRADTLNQIARALATVDATLSLARVARENDYVRPTLHTGRDLEIIGGRHPVVEALLSTGTGFIPNDVAIGSEGFQIMVLTGPNMAGKSTYLRQVALIALLAQIGSYVPAKTASVGLIDRIFTRIGAGDNLAGGESTFLVEMTEVANILRHATPRSLVILDEVGRGTSTFDGLSLAWAITEFLHNSPQSAAKTLFATHYHELNKMAAQYPRIRNFRVEVEEWGDRVVFLHKISSGETDRSYGIEVARLAGLPPQVVDRARALLPTWEGVSRGEPIPEIELETAPKIQLTLFETDTQRVVDALLELDMDTLTPRQAIDKLFEIKEIVTSEGLKRGQKRT